MNDLEYTLYTCKAKSFPGILLMNVLYKDLSRNSPDECFVRLLYGYIYEYFTSTLQVHYQ